MPQHTRNITCPAHTYWNVRFAQVVDNFCKDWVDEESCAVWYGELDLFTSMREKFATAMSPEDFDAQYPGCPANIDYNMLGANCTQAVICGLR